VAPNHTFEIPIIYNITLTVTDGAGNVDSDLISITVVLDLTNPVAHAGTDQSVLQGTKVELDGSGTTDNSGYVADFSWNFVYDGSPVILSGEKPSFTFDIIGNYEITLKAEDGAGNWDTDYVWVNISADTQAPFASAGSDQTKFRNSFVIIDGFTSSDNVGVRSWIWTFFDGTDDITITGSTLIYAFSLNGDYEITLNVSDIAGNWDTDVMQLTIVTDDSPPVADAGFDQIVSQGDSVEFNGLASDDNIGIVNYEWDIDGSDGLDWSQPDYEGSDIWNPSHTYSAPGKYIVTLRVTDDAGNLDTDTVLITVTGNDQLVTKVISGTVVDEEGSPISGASVKLENSNNVFVATTDANGKYRIMDVPEGSYQLVTNQGDYGSKKQDVVISSENTQELSEVTLNSATSEESQLLPWWFPFLFIFILLIIIAISTAGRKKKKQITETEPEVTQTTESNENIESKETISEDKKSQ
jgi:PKD repeat protein